MTIGTTNFIQLATGLKISSRALTDIITTARIFARRGTARLSRQRCITGPCKGCCSNHRSSRYQPLLPAQAATIKNGTVGNTGSMIPTTASARLVIAIDLQRKTCSGFFISGQASVWFLRTASSARSQFENTLYIAKERGTVTATLKSTESSQLLHQWIFARLQIHTLDLRLSGQQLQVLAQGCGKTLSFQCQCHG